MKVTHLDIGDVLLIELDVYEDERGFFVERFQVEQFREHGLPTRSCRTTTRAPRPVSCAGCTSSTRRRRASWSG